MRMPVLILLLCLAGTTLAQSSSSESVSERVKADKPTVYVEYICQDKNKYYLRMYNNTIWHISVRSDKLFYPSQKPIRLRNGVNTYAAPNDREIPLQYRVEKYGLPWESVKVPKAAYPDNGFSEWIASQDSILFPVQAQYLRKDLQVFVTFNYEWEVTRQGYTINDPEHRVSFRGLDSAGVKSLACSAQGALNTSVSSRPLPR